MESKLYLQMHELKELHWWFIGWHPIVAPLLRSRKLLAYKHHLLHSGLPFSISLMAAALILVATC